MSKIKSLTLAAVVLFPMGAMAGETVVLPNERVGCVEMKHTREVFSYLRQRIVDGGMSSSVLSNNELRAIQMEWLNQPVPKNESPMRLCTWMERDVQYNVIQKNGEYLSLCFQKPYLLNKIISSGTSKEDAAWMVNRQNDNEVCYWVRIPEYDGWR